eukprot:TRINITY_DN76421_c0_g1_i1.p1 TRINITY_DN76421_c0_g1~~TRINITY_DN76421_c0_g1_i1.p1  ORF type:complete len:603 (+),score=79.11 TRINITY_DN76421_c0_g1_i1:124-1932(+)
MELRPAGVSAYLCPPTNNPWCWDRVFTCRRCCDLSLGPTGDDNCWVQSFGFDYCCRFGLQSEYKQEDVYRCARLSGWLAAGFQVSETRASLASTGYTWAATLPVCPALSFALSLGDLMPRLVASSLTDGVALHQAEGILQWVIDSLVEVLAGHSMGRPAIFLSLQRLLAQVARRRQREVPTRQPIAVDPPVSAFVGKVFPSTDASSSQRRHSFWPRGPGGRALRLSLDWDLPFDPTAIQVAMEESAPGYFAENASMARDSQSREVEPCTLEMSFVFAARADILRVAEGQRSVGFREALRMIQRCLADVSKPNNQLLSLLAEDGSPPLLALLDRLECETEVTLTPSRNSSGASHGWPIRVGVLPFRDYESSYIRGLGDLHCTDEVKRLILRRLPRDSGSFVEVGAHLGSCTLWAALLDKSIEAVAVEPYGAAVSALQRSIVVNGLGNRVRALRACVSLEGEPLILRRELRSVGDAVPQVSWSSAPADADDAVEEITCGRLDSILPRGRIDVLRVCTAGTELAALRSADGLFERGLIRSVAVHQGAGLDESLKIAAFLWRRGLHVEVAGGRIFPGDAEAFATAWRRKRGFHSVLVGIADDTALG